MEKTKGTISAFQFYVMLFLSRTLTTVTYLSSYTENIRLSDMLVQPIFRIVIGTLIMLPVFRLYRKHRDKNVLELLNEKSEVLAKVVSIVFIFFKNIFLKNVFIFQPNLGPTHITYNMDKAQTALAKNTPKNPQKL